MFVAERELVPQGAEFTGSMTASHDLGVSFRETVGVSYLDAPLAVFRSPTEEGGDRFDVVVDHTPLNGDKLFSFLKEVAPNKRLPGYPNGVVADWQVVEVASPFHSDSLVQLHQHLGLGWVEFIRSQPAFKSTLEAMYEPSFTRYATTQLLRAARARSRIEGGLIRDIALLPDEGLKALRDQGLDIEDALFEAIAREINQGRPPKRKVKVSPQTKPELQRRLESWSGRRKTDLIRHIFRSVAPTRREEVIDGIVEGLYDTVSLLPGEDVVYPRISIEEGVSLASCYDARYARQEGTYEADFMDIPKREGGNEVVFLGSVRKIAPDPVISPLLAWTRSRRGDREFVFERSQSGERPVHFRDGVLGALAIAYLQPEVRADWPETMRIRDSRPQPIGVAQVPVLALMRRAQLLKTDFVEAAESIAA